MKPGPRFLKSLFEVAHVEFQTYDLSDHKLVFSSGMARQMLGYSEDEYLKLSADFYKSIIHPDDFQKVHDTVEKICQAKKGEIIEMTIRVRRSDGFYIWATSRQMILERINNGNTCKIIREVEDVTKLIEIQNELEERVKQLREVSFKNSHLLRSPVSSIIGLVDLIDEGGIISEHNLKIYNYLKQTIKKLDEVIGEINDASEVD
jgi:PAS domain S-box-containing protein